MYFPLFLVFVCINLLSMPLCATEKPYKIVCLLSGPRAMSTAFLRMMESRGDFTIYNEPSQAAFNIIYYPELTKGWFYEGVNLTFAGVKRDLYASLTEGNVFVKEMSFATYDFILQDSEYMKNPSLYFLFLVRDPHHVIISFYRKLEEILPGMNDLIGLRKLYEEYEMIKKLNPNGAKVIFSKDLYENPRETMANLCDHLDIPFLEEAFSWKSHKENFDAKNLWNEIKIGNTAQHWHGRAIQSTKMGKPSSYEVDSNGKPTFSEILDEEHRLLLKEIYQDNLVYYKKFLDSEQRSNVLSN